MATLEQYKALTAEMVRLAEITRTNRDTVINRCADVGRSVLRDGGTVEMAGEAMFSVLVRNGFADESMWISTTDQTARVAADQAEIDEMAAESARQVAIGEGSELAHIAAEPVASVAVPAKPRKAPKTKEDYERYGREVGHAYLRDPRHADWTLADWQKFYRSLGENDTINKGMAMWRKRARNRGIRSVIVKHIDAVIASLKQVGHDASGHVWTEPDYAEMLNTYRAHCRVCDARVDFVWDTSGPRDVLVPDLTTIKHAHTA